MQNSDTKTDQSLLYAVPQTQETGQNSTPAVEEKMITISSKRFGEIKFAENSVVVVHGGLIGLDGHENFIIIHGPEDGPFYWLQCVDNPDLSLVMVDPLSFKPDYDPPIPVSVTRNLDIQATGDMSIYVIITIPSGNPQGLTANLLAPMVFNTRTRRAKQLVLDERHYSHRYKVIRSQENQPDPS